MSKNLLVSLAGQSPQIITETFYCYAVMQTPPVKFDEVYILTTTIGKKKAETALLNSENGKLFQLCREYGLALPKIEIHVIEDESKQALSDIRSNRDNESMAVHFFQFFRTLTEDPATTLYCTIAGGRKTMSAFGMLAFGVFARKHDRLSHVLVNPPEAESSKNFYYPTQAPIEITNYQDQPVIYNHKPLQSSEVQLDLAELPTIRMRTMLEEGGYDIEEMNYQELMKVIQNEIDLSALKALVLDRKTFKASIDNKSLGLNRSAFIVLSYLAEKALNAKKDVEKTVDAVIKQKKAAVNQTYAGRKILSSRVRDELIRHVTTCLNLPESSQEIEKISALSGNAFEKRVWAVNKKIASKIKPQKLADLYSIKILTSEDTISYALLLANSKIEIKTQ